MRQSRRPDMGLAQNHGLGSASKHPRAAHAAFKAYFCNKIGPNRQILRRKRMSAFRGKAAVARTSRDVAVSPIPSLRHGHLSA